MTQDAARPENDTHESLGRVLRGFGALSAASILGQVIGFAALVYVAHRIGRHDIGSYNFALGLAGYFALLANLGVGYRATRDVAAEPDRAGTVALETFLIQLFAAALLYVILIISAPLIVQDALARRMLPIVALQPIATLLTADWLLLALRRQGLVAWWRLAGQIVYGCGVPLLVGAGATGAIHYAWLNAVGLGITWLGCFAGAVQVLRLRRRSGATLAWPRPRTLVRRVRVSAPFNYSLIMLQIYGSAGLVMLGYLDSTQAVGLFAVATKLPSALVTLANSWLNAFFPHVTRKLRADRTGLAQDLTQITTFALLLVIVLSIGAALTSGVLMTTLFGEQFRGAGTVFVLMTFASALVLPEASFSNVLLATDSQRYYVRVLTVTAVLTLVLNAVLIVTDGAVGAGIAAIGAQVFLTIAVFIGARRAVGAIRVDRRLLLQSVPAISAMTAWMALTRTTLGLVPEILGAGLILGAVGLATLRLAPARPSPGAGVVLRSVSLDPAETEE